jgi:hypothetical protein
VRPGLFNPLSHDEDDDFANGNPHFNIINNVKDHSIANVFCFGAFADKITGIVYNDCIGEFLFMSLDGNVCFFVMYKTKAILATPISGLNSASILEAHKQNFKYLAE